MKSTALVCSSVRKQLIAVSRFHSSLVRNETDTQRRCPIITQIINCMTSSSHIMWDYFKSCLQAIIGTRIYFEDAGMTVSLGRRSIGEGSFSDVVIGIDVRTFKKYAVKKMLVQTKEIELNVKNEIDALRRFKHKNIVPYVGHKYSMDRGRDGKILYILFPYISKGNLRSYLNTMLDDNKMKRPDIYTLLKCFKSIAEAILVLHNNDPSYVHNDIKPENILLTDDYQPLLTDFGSVRLASIPINTRNDSLRISEDSAQFCTPQYRPPELYDPPVGSVLDSRTDVWSIGCLYYAWVYGYAPYELTYDKNGKIKPMDTSYLRILSGNIAYPNTSIKQKDMIIKVLMEYILIQDYKFRPFIYQVIEKLESIMSNISQYEDNKMMTSSTTFQSAVNI